MKKVIVMSMIGLSFCLAGLTACNNTSSKTEEANQIKLTQIRDSLKLDSFQRAEAARIALQEEQKNQNAIRRNSNLSESSNSKVQVETTSQPISSQTPTQEKKGWSDAAKGTAIGAGVGAGVGALIDKDKRARGAIIGAAIGGGSGYAIGRKSDRESGRVQKK